METLEQFVVNRIKTGKFANLLKIPAGKKFDASVTLNYIYTAENVDDTHLVLTLTRRGDGMQIERVSLTYALLVKAIAPLFAKKAGSAKSAAKAAAARENGKLGGRPKKTK